MLGKWKQDLEAEVAGTRLAPSERDELIHLRRENKEPQGPFLNFLKLSDTSGGRSYSFDTFSKQPLFILFGK